MFKNQKLPNIATTGGSNFKSLSTNFHKKHAQKHTLVWTYKRTSTHPTKAANGWNIEEPSSINIQMPT